VKVIQGRTGLCVACPQEITYRCGFIGPAALEQLAGAAPSPDYRSYLERLLEDRVGGAA
jgi:glucose-1-phosphate thymidylyltransferase